MQRNLVNALTELGIPVRRGHRSNAPILCRPSASPIFGPVNAAGGDRYVHPLFVVRIKDNRMQGEAAVAWHPARTVRMIEQATNQRPRLAVVARFEKCRRFYAAIKDIRLILSPQCYLPNVVQRNTCVGWKSNCRLLRSYP